MASRVEAGALGALDPTRWLSRLASVAAAELPAMFVTAGFNDPRVSYHEPAKWVARLRATGKGERPLVMKTEMVAGHGGKSGRYDSWREEAEVLAFILTTLNVTSS